MAEQIHIKYFSDEIEPLKYIDGKSDWIDLRSSEHVILQKGDYHQFKLGVAMKLPKGYEAHIVPRSSTFKNYGLIQTNSCGIVDETYCGDNDEWMWPAYATRDTEVNVNDRIAQFRIIKHQPEIEFVTEEKLADADRGGFGSTGIN